MASFRNVYTSLLLVIAGSTDRELARQVNYLKAENQILRSRLPGRISLTEREKNRLIRFAKNLGSALNELATIVHPGTIRRWIREAAAKSKARRKDKSGRPRTAKDIEKLILKLAKDNSWGYTRILGELKKLRIESVTRNTVKNILKRNGFESGPIESTKAGGPKCKILMLDNDAKYSKLFMDVFEKGKIKTQRTPIRSRTWSLCRTIRSNDQARMSRPFRRFWPQTHGPPVPRIQRLLSRRTAASGTGERACD